MLWLKLSVIIVKYNLYVIVIHCNCQILVLFTIKRETWVVGQGVARGGLKNQ